MKISLDWPSCLGEDLRKWWTGDERWTMPGHQSMGIP